MTSVTRSPTGSFSVSPSLVFRGTEFFVLRGIQAATDDQWAAKLCWERDSCFRQRVGLGDLKFPSILGFQILCLIETEVNVKSSTGLPLRAPALGLLFFHLCTFKSLLWSRFWRISEGTTQEGKLLLPGGCIPGIPKIPVPFPPHIVNIRFWWGGQKGHSPNCSCSQALIWIIQLILRESSSWADLKPIWQGQCWFRLTGGHCLSRRMTSSLLGEQNQVWEHKTNPRDSLQWNQRQPSPNSLLSKTKP